MSQLDAFLFRETPHELKQKNSGHYIPDYPLSKGTSARLTNELVMPNQAIFISKHHRYAAYPSHSHQFFELNYIYHGQCRQLINDQPYTLKRGDILLMDAGTRHQIDSLDQEDIVINLLFKNTETSLDTLQAMQPNHTLLYDFLLDGQTDALTHQPYLIIPNEQANEAIPTLHHMLQEYFFPQTFSQSILSHYLDILLFQLARALPGAQELVTKQQTTPFIRALQLIDQQYATLTLSEAAKQLGFNKNYLSNLIKQKSHHTFTQLITRKKLMMAHLLIESTGQPIDSICETVGFSNKSYFYKHYRILYGQTPSETRYQSRL